MIYLDTSVLGALFFREPTAARLLAGLEPLPHGELCISAWSLAEMASVGAIKERTGAVTWQERVAALAACDRFISDWLQLAEVDPGDFRAAARLLEVPVLALRAGDALHLAIAHRLHSSLATLDRRQAVAAEHFGVPLFPL